ncbi:MAG TPA: hypothetical protein VFQ25_00530 [Ktedonobacterales bacterium]|nr:hypothetical protein [Ktedonobacterales bacterium]
METVAWVGALETAVGLLYLALFGQRSIAQWLDDRRRRGTGAKTGGQEADQESAVESSGPPPRVRPRLLSIQAIGDYLEYMWRDPVEGALITARAITLGASLIFRIIALVLLPGALALTTLAYVAASQQLNEVAGTMANIGGSAFGLLVPSAILAALAVAGTYGLAGYRKNQPIEEEKLRQYRLRQEKEAEETHQYLSRLDKARREEQLRQAEGRPQTQRPSHRGPAEQ